ncbi:MAG TPA: L-lactate dehydrogenase [Oscillospiraceae bacterium]|nr:L-lactate dehydrogenase [Oscillospiraceae bacterium]
MKDQSRKVVLVGTGFVGMSYAYALLNQNACDELVLIDLDRKKAEGEAMDLNHGLAFSGSHMKITAGDYSDCYDADIVAISAGVSQKPGESRRDLLMRNKAVFESIISPVMESGFSGIFLIATNPVDIMAHITKTISGFPRSRVIGTGTTLDTARLRYMLGTYFNVDPRNVHAYVIGEHGDSEFVPWSQALVATKPVVEMCAESNGEYSCKGIEEIENDVRGAAQKIIEAKKATYYGIGMAMVRITKAIFGDENSVLTVSTLLEGEYSREGVYAGVPCIIGVNGIERIITLTLTEEEKKKFDKSCDIIAQGYSNVDFV